MQGLLTGTYGRVGCWVRRCRQRMNRGVGVKSSPTDGTTCLFRGMEAGTDGKSGKLQGQIAQCYLSDHAQCPNATSKNVVLGATSQKMPAREDPGGRKRSERRERTS